MSIFVKLSVIVFLNLPIFIELKAGSNPHTRGGFQDPYFLNCCILWKSDVFTFEKRSRRRCRSTNKKGDRSAMMVVFTNSQGSVGFSVWFSVTSHQKVQIFISTVIYYVKVRYLFEINVIKSIHSVSLNNTWIQHLNLTSVINVVKEKNLTVPEYESLKTIRHFVRRWPGWINWTKIDASSR